MNCTNLKLLFELNPEAAFNQDPLWVCHHQPLWIHVNKFNWMLINTSRELRVKIFNSYYRKMKEEFYAK